MSFLGETETEAARTALEYVKTLKDLGVDREVTFQEWMEGYLRHPCLGALRADK